MIGWRAPSARGGTKGPLGRWRAVIAGALLLAGGCASPLSASPYGLFVVRPDGTGSRRIAEEVAEPVWSPDGASIAYAAADGIYVVGIDGAAPRRVAAATNAGVPSWSPDGTRIAFVDRDARALVVQRVGGSASPLRIPLLDEAATGGLVALAQRNRPAWSPDGERIAFVTWDGHGDVIAVVGADGGGRREVTRVRLSAEPLNPEAPGGPRKAQSDAGFPAWEPAGNRIAYALYPETAGSAGGIYLTDAEGRRRRTVTRLPARWGPVWAPSGSRILFVHRRRDQIDLYVVDANRRGATNLTPGFGPRVESADWSPEGSQIVFAADGDLYRVARFGGAVAVVAASPRREANPAWSPDGSLIAFSVGDDPIAN